MKTDRYTKIVLTVIAAALVLIVIRDYAPTVRANAVMDVNIVSINGNAFGAMQVGRLSPALPVKVVQ